MCVCEDLVCYFSIIFLAFSNLPCFSQFNFSSWLKETLSWVTDMEVAE